MESLNSTDSVHQAIQPYFLEILYDDNDLRDNSFIKVETFF